MCSTKGFLSTSDTLAAATVMHLMMAREVGLCHCRRWTQHCRLTGLVGMQGDFVVLASEPVCICGVDVAAPQQLRVRNSQQKMSMSELRSIFSRQFTEYEVSARLHFPSSHALPRSDYQPFCSTSLRDKQSPSTMSNRWITPLQGGARVAASW